MSRLRAWLIGAVLAAAAGVVAWSCASGGAKEAAAPEPGASEADMPSEGEHADSTDGTNAEPTPGSPAPGASTPGAVAPSGSSTSLPLAASANAPAGSPSGPGARIAQAVATSDPRDLAFLSHIERELKRNPPPEVHALIRRRQQGATRDELVAGARALPDLPLRVLALRWVDSVFPGRDAGAAPAPQPKASGRSPVQPIEPVR